MAWTLKYTGQFKKDLKRYKHDTIKIEHLQVVLNHLEENGLVPEVYKPHMLKGNYEGFMECHVENDFLLIWIDNINFEIRLTRLGSHSELFNK